MKNFLFCLCSLAIIACAQVPYDENGRVIIPPTANISEAAKAGPLDAAVEELTVQIKPGQEEFRAVAIGATSLLLICRIRRDCDDIDFSASVKVGAGLGNTTARAVGTQRELASLGRFEEENQQITDLNRLTEAFVIMAARDAEALQGQGAQKASWVSLYQSRVVKVEKAIAAVTESQVALDRYIKTQRPSRLGRDVRRAIVEVSQDRRALGQKLRADLQRLRDATAQMARADLATAPL